MKTSECMFCHKDIPVGEFDDHVAQHLERRPDGQQKDYATLPPNERIEPGDAFDSAPRWYKHSVCGSVTGMPEEIIRTYLRDPWFYWADATFCCGCGEHVPISECNWTETGESLQEYTDKLREGVPRSKGCLGGLMLALAKMGVFRA